MKLLSQLLLFILFFSPLVFAENSKNQSKNACRADLEKFCKDVSKEKGAKVKCLKKHAAELTPACKTKLESLKEKKETEKFESAASDEPARTKISEKCKGVKVKDPLFKECMKEKLEVLKGNWSKYSKERAKKKALASPTPSSTPSPSPTPNPSP